MTKIKLCGMTRLCDIETANTLLPEFIGFVFAEKSRRYIHPEAAGALRRALDPSVCTVGVFVREKPETVALLLNEGIIDLAQLHGGEDDSYIAGLRMRTDKPLIQAFRVDTAADLERAYKSRAEYILLDHGAGGTGSSFNWKLLEGFDRPYFLAGGLGVDNVREAVTMLHPFAVDVSSGIETDGLKDRKKMQAFVAAVRAASDKEGAK